jgi:hypothetical protein
VAGEGTVGALLRTTCTGQLDSVESTAKIPLLDAPYNFPTDYRALFSRRWKSLLAPFWEHQILHPVSLCGTKARIKKISSLPVLPLEVQRSKNRPTPTVPASSILRFCPKLDTN